MAVRILTEDLVLFRDGRGRIGLVSQHCAHRGASLEFGRVDAGKNFSDGTLKPPEIVSA